MSLFSDPAGVPGGVDDLAAAFPFGGKTGVPFLDAEEQPALGLLSLDALGQPGTISWQPDPFGLAAIDSTQGCGVDGNDPLTGALVGLSFNAALADGAGNTRASARNIGSLAGTQSFSDWVGKTDTNDFYRFDLSQASSFSATLNGLSADADLQLLSSTGAVLASSVNAGTAAESISRALTAGTYYTRVYRYSGNTNYNLTLVATASSPATPGFSAINGYGEASVERAIERLRGINIPDLPNQFSGGLYGLDRIGAPEAWSAGYTGLGMIVAVLDTGVDRTHQDLDANIWTNSREVAGNGLDDDANGYVDDLYGWNFNGNNNVTLDVQGHGTHVAGSIAAERNGFGVTGVAYESRIMPVKVLSDSGSGSFLDVANGIRYAANNGAHVINLSLGGGTGDSSVRSAIEYAWNRGVAVVMASGNDGAASPGYPAAYASNWGIAVGAVNNTGAMASFSNRAGSTVLDYVTTAGVDVTSTTPNNGYATWSGTSMATPQAAGAMALLIQANRASGRNLSLGELEQLLMATASNGSISSVALSPTATSSTGSSSLRALRESDPGQSSREGGAPELKAGLSPVAVDLPSSPSVDPGRQADGVMASRETPASRPVGGRSFATSDEWILSSLERSRGGEDALDLLTGLRTRPAPRPLAG